MWLCVISCFAWKNSAYGNAYSPQDQSLYRSFDDGFRYYSMGGMYNESNFIYVDPHVLGSPTLVDVNNDGHIEGTFTIDTSFFDIPPQ
jgi:hypothetical protein